MRTIELLCSRGGPDSGQQRKRGHDPPGCKGGNNDVK
jgi:hypothetical protein